MTFTANGAEQQLYTDYEKIGLKGTKQLLQNLLGLLAGPPAGPRPRQSPAQPPALHQLLGSSALPAYRRYIRRPALL